MQRRGNQPRSIRWALAVALGLVAGRAANAQDAGSLSWKLKAGESLHYQMKQSTKTQVKVPGQGAQGAGQDITTNVDQTMEMTWAVKSVDPSGTAVMNQTIDSIRSKISSPFATVEYDSRSGKEPEGPIAAGIVPMFKALVGKHFEFKLTPNGELRDVKVPEGLVQALKEAGPSAPAVGMFSEEGLRNMITESSLVLAAKPGMPSWTRETKLPMPPVGSLRISKTYTLEPQKKNGLDVVSLKSDIALEPAADQPFTVKVRDQKGTGEFLFDNAKGRVTSSHVEQHIEMEMTVQNMQLTQISDSKTEMTLMPEPTKGTD